MNGSSFQSSYHHAEASEQTKLIRPSDLISRCFRVLPIGTTSEARAQRNHSRGSTPTFGKLRGSTAGFQLPVVQTQGDQFLKAGIDLLMHGRVLRGDIAQFFQQTGPAVIVVPLRILQPLAVMSSMGLW